MAEVGSTRKNFLFAGDSLTQRGAGKDGWISILQAEYVRKADFVNRGLSGYNTEWFMCLLPELITPKFCAGKEVLYDLIVLWLGANDSVPPNNPQYVSVDEYGRNLVDIITHLKTKAHQVVVLSPPPVDDVIAFTGRCNDNTLKYALASKSAAERCKVEHIDMFSILMEHDVAGENYLKLLSDGLHFNATGQSLVAEIVQAHLQRQLPRLAQENVPIQFPDWKDFANNLEACKSRMGQVRSELGSN